MLNHSVVSFNRAFSGSCLMRVSAKITISEAVGKRAFNSSEVFTFSCCISLLSVFDKPIPLLATPTEIKRPIAPPTNEGNS